MRRMSDTHMIIKYLALMERLTSRLKTSPRAKMLDSSASTNHAPTYYVGGLTGRRFT
jgi:hypothetical protein